MRSRSETGGCGLLEPRYTALTMTDVEKEILQSLNDLEAGVAAMKTADPKPNLIPLFNRLNDFARQLPRNSHAQLIHYLGNGSYEKARLWLLGRDAENRRGLCGR